MILIKENYKDLSLQPRDIVLALISSIKDLEKNY